MRLSQFKEHLDHVAELNFVQPNGASIEKHFHITEAGLTTKHFIDCGGKIRTEKTVNFQIWVAEDNEHCLDPGKLKKIIKSSESLFGNEDLEIEVEYQIETIGRFGLGFSESDFLLLPKQTNCLAKDHCGIPTKKKLSLSELQNACCSPGSGCC